MAIVAVDKRGKNQGFAFFAGPILWVIQLLLGYILADFTSTGLPRLWYYILSAVVVVIILAAGVVAVVSWLRHTPVSRRDITRYAEPSGSQEFIAASGLYLASIFFLLTLITGLFTIFLTTARMITQPFP
ncbi:MAG TPA: hypothetical protein VF813_12370 [Anaerolineaceae bacterium]